MATWNYFTDEESKGLDNELMARLDQARHIAGIGFIITDGLRTPATNTDPNSVQNSAHLTGHAVDIRCVDSHTLWKMLHALLEVGFKRIGIYFNSDAHPTHLHVDNDLTKPQEVVFLTLEK